MEERLQKLNLSRLIDNLAKRFDKVDPAGPGPSHDSGAFLSSNNRTGLSHWKVNQYSH